MKSNKDELYVKVIVLDEIYYFIANNFFKLKLFGVPNI